MPRRLIVTIVCAIFVALVSLGGVLTRGRAQGAPLTTTITLPVSSDTYIYDIAPNTNYSSSSALSVGKNELVGQRHILLEFDSLSLPAGADITDATITLIRIINRDDPAPGGASTPEAFAFYPEASLTGWDASLVTWATYSGSNQDFGDPDAAVDAVTATVDVTNIVQAWADGTIENRGIVLRPRGSEAGSVDVRSSELGPGPELVINYTVPTATPTNTPTGTLQPTATPTNTGTPSATATATANPYLCTGGTFSVDVEIDTWVGSLYPTSAYNFDDLLKVGTINDSVRHTLLKFPVEPDLIMPPDYYLYEASLDFVVDRNDGTNKRVLVHYYSLDGEISSATTWQNQPSPNIYYGTGNIGTAPGAKSLDITFLVNAWLSGFETSRSIGLGLISEDEPVVHIRSAEFEDGAFTPQLTISCGQTATYSAADRD